MGNEGFSPEEANILIVNYNRSNINSVAKVLEAKGYKNIYEIPENKFTVSGIKENVPDIILIYISCNNTKLYNACKMIKEENKLKEIPIIFIGDYGNIDKDKVFEAGGDDYLAIPLNCNEIIKRIGKHLNYRAMKLRINKFENYQPYDQLMRLYEDLKKENRKLKKEIFDKKQELEEITFELKEFNVLLEEEISERTKTEEALEESERQFRYSIEKAPIPIMLYDEEGKVRKLNKAWTNITGYTIDDMSIISKWASVSEVFTKNLFDIKSFDKINVASRHNNCEFSVKIRDGKVCVWNFHIGYIGELQDGHKLFVILAIDITEKKRMEELQKRVEEERKMLYEIKEYEKIRTEFFSNISHELRTPINVIFSALQMFEFNFKDLNRLIDVSRYIKVMKQNCYRILRLINNIIDITKIDSGYFDINEENVNIIDLIENVTLSVADYIENKGLSLTFDTNVEEKIIACDSEKIERMLLNLLSNAVKFTPSGGEIMVIVEAEHRGIYIRVKDTGRGIPKEKLGTIFDRFVQVDKSLTRDNEGSGIGLSIVKSLVKLHGGKITVKSDIDQGTEFIIYIPCKKIEDTSEKILFSNSTNKSYIEKINIEFSDIYN